MNSFIPKFRISLLWAKQAVNNDPKQI